MFYENRSKLLPFEELIDVLMKIESLNIPGNTIVRYIAKLFSIARGTHATTHVQSISHPGGCHIPLKSAAKLNSLLLKILFLLRTGLVFISFLFSSCNLV